MKTPTKWFPTATNRRPSGSPGPIRFACNVSAQPLSSTGATAATESAGFSPVFGCLTSPKSNVGQLNDQSATEIHNSGDQRFAHLFGLILSYCM